MQRLLLLLLAVTVVMCGMLVILKYQFPKVPQLMPITDITDIELPQTTYTDKNGQTAQVAYDNDNGLAYLTYHSTTFAYDYDMVELTATTSASGAMYANPDFDLMLWEKAGNIAIYESDDLIFESAPQTTTISREEAVRYLTEYSWIWYETNTSEGDVISPRRTDAFSLTFSADGSVSGTTDCNGFSGTYSVDSWQLTFGSLMSTLMFCEDSQETEFTSAIGQTESFAFNKEGNLVLQMAQQKGEIYFVPSSAQ